MTSYGRATSTATGTRTRQVWGTGGHFCRKRRHRCFIPTSLAISYMLNFLTQGLPLLVVNHCLKQSPLPRRMGNAFMSQQVQTFTLNATHASYVTESGYFQSYGLWARHCASGDDGSLVVMPKQIHVVFPFILQRSEPFFNVEQPVALESGDAVVAWHPIHRCIL
jgi:hypothetical protein